MRRRHRWLTLTAAAALTLSACADDAPDEASSATDPDLASGSAADDPDVAEQLAVEAEELGIELSDEELADAEALLTGDDAGSATVTIGGERIEFPRTACYRGSEWFAIEALNDDWGDVQVRFDLDYRPDAEPNTYKWDSGDIRLYPLDQPTLETPWGQDGPVVGDETSARGSGLVWDNRVAPDDREATAVEVELEITCAG